MPRSIGRLSPSGDRASPGRQERPERSANRGRALSPRTLPVHKIKGRAGGGGGEEAEEEEEEGEPQEQEYE